MHLQTFPHDEGTRRWGPQGQHIGYTKQNKLIADNIR